jgi:electron transport complex protein RnfG
MNEITKMVLVTTVICVFAAALLAGLKQGLSARIARQEDYYVRGPVIQELLKGSPNDPLADKVIIELDGEEVGVYPWIEEGKVRRIALERHGKGGYGGDVVVMTAVDLETDRIYGVRVTQHKETPGVGSRAADPVYLKRYQKLPINQEIRLTRDGGQVDALSGATRSSTAIADGVNRAAQFVLKHEEEIVKRILEKKM